jgi:hypothetical protein
MTLELNIESKAPTAPPVETEDLTSKPLTEKQLAFAANVFKAYEKTMSEGERLSALAQVDNDKFEDEVEEQVDAFLENDADFQELFAELKAARRRGGGDSFVAEIKSRRNKARQLILTSLDLLGDSRANGIYEATQNVEELLKDIPKEHENIGLALTTLGIKTKLGDEPGEYRYSFPYDLMPEKVNNRWTNYLQNVKDHIAEPDGPAKEAFDTTRHYAHEGITLTISPILQLDKFGLSPKEKKELFAKMRNDELIFNKTSNADTPALTPDQLIAARQLTRHRYSH